MKSKTNISVLDNRGIRVNPSVIIGNTGNGYVSGDILDANAVYDVIKGGDDEDQSDINTLSQNVTSLQNTVNRILSNSVMSNTVRNTMVLTQQQYNDLVIKEPSTEYNIID